MIKLLSHIIIFSLVLNCSLIAKPLSLNDSNYKKSSYIISEKNYIQIVGAYSSNMNITISKKITYAINDKKGKTLLSKVSLPETFDPTFIEHSPKGRNNQEVLSGLEVNYFNVRATRNGIIQEINTKEKVESIEKYSFDNRYGNFSKYHYSINSLEINDTVEISYSYTVPYRLNSLHFLSKRIFFNGELFKEEYELQVYYPERVNVEFFNRKGAAHDKTRMDKKNKIYFWNMYSLKGNINEIGSRAYKELPHLIICIKPMNYTYLPTFRSKDSSNKEKSMAERYLPSYVFYTAYRENGHQKVINDMEQDLNIKQYVELRKFYKLHTTKRESGEFDYYVEQKQSQYQNLKTLKNYIADSVKFLNDIKYYKRLDNYRLRMGENLMENKIRDITRYEVYLSFISKMNLDYMTGYASDIRSGIVDNEYLSPMASSDFFLLPVTYEGKMQFILPKSGDFGYYLNEYPFYYDGASTRVIQAQDYQNEDYDIKTELSQIVIPLYNPLDNKRISSVMAKVDLKENQVDFKARVNLSGQYTTMTKGLYMKNYIDETIHPLYHKKVWEIDNSITLDEYNLEIVEEEYPFKSKVEASYSSKSVLKKEKDSVTIKTNGLFGHISKVEACNGERTLNYYPDFLGTDSYVYVFQFEEAIRLPKKLKNIRIDNDYAKYIFQLEKINKNSIKLSSYLNIINPEVASTEFQHVCEIYKAVEKAKSTNIVVYTHRSKR